MVYIFSGYWCHGGRQLCSHGTFFAPLGESHGKGTANNTQTDGHRDYKTELAQWTNSVKSEKVKNSKVLKVKKLKSEIKGKRENGKKLNKEKKVEKWRKKWKSEEKRAKKWEKKAKEKCENFNRLKQSEKVRKLKY